MRKNAKILLSLLMFICVVLLQPLTVQASILEDMSVMTQDDNNAYKFWSALNVQQIEGRCLEPIKYFDVNEKGFVVIATNKQSIVILNDKNEQLSAFSFDVYGDYFVKWENETILLFLEREDIIVQMNINGDMLSIINVDRDDLHTAEKWRELRKEKSVSIDNGEYYLKSNNAFFTTATSLYSKIEKIDTNGNIIDIYNVGDSYTGLVVLFYLSFISVLGLFVYFIARLFWSIKKRN